MLTELSANIKWGKPPEMSARIPGGDTQSGSEDLLELLSGNHKASPSSLPSKTSHKQHIVSIDKLR